MASSAVVDCFDVGLLVKSSPWTQAKGRAQHRHFLAAAFHAYAASEVMGMDQLLVSHRTASNAADDDDVMRLAASPRPPPYAEHLKQDHPSPPAPDPANHHLGIPNGHRQTQLAIHAPPPPQRRYQRGLGVPILANVYGPSFVISSKSMPRVLSGKAGAKRHHSDPCRT